MKQRKKESVGMMVIAVFLLLIGLAVVPETADSSAAGDTIPMMQGAKIIKEKTHQGSSSLELEVNAPADAVAKFYNQAMSARGWPSGMVMSTPNRSALMLHRDGAQFAVKAEEKNGTTRVTIVLLQTGPSRITSGTKARLPETAPQPLPETPSPASGKVAPTPSRELPVQADRPLQETPADSRPVSDQAPTFGAPDFTVTDVAYWPERTRIRARVRNGGKPFNGSLAFSLNMADPYSPYSLDEIVSVPVALNTTDAVWVTRLADFQWPDPIEHPVLNTVVAADPDSAIAEQDERNNHLHKTLYVSCGVHIEALSNQSVDVGDMDRFAIYGTFGSQAAGRVVCLEKDNERQRAPIQSWANGAVIVDIHGIGTGTYDVVVYCSDPDRTNAYASNRKSLRIKNKRAKIQLSSGAFDARDMADAMARGYEEWFDVGEDLFKVWIEIEDHGISANAIRSKWFASAVFEIFRQEYRLAYQELSDVAQVEEGYQIQHTFTGIGPGLYTLKLTIKDAKGQADATRSFHFQF